MTFLTAEWRRLALANYAVDPAVLRPYLPHKTELDAWNGTHYVSLVGFMFRNVRVLGLKIPFHVNFEEVNLRFYVRHKKDGEWRRGVVFIKEIVPKPAITLVANTLYKEHYHTMKMSHRWEERADGLLTRYEWVHRGRNNSFTIDSERNTIAIPCGSEAEFITEHYWGYTRITDQKTFEYEVTHPSWQQYTVRSSIIDVDYGAVYGADFAFLSGQAPTSVMLAEGSPITVKNKRTV